MTPRAARTCTCVVCGASFPGRGRANICSPECRRARRRGYDAGCLAMPPPTRACAICGAEFAARTSKKTCSDDCERTRKRARWRGHWHGLTAEQKAAHYAALRAKRRAKPEWAHAVDARKYARIKADPERLAATRAVARESYRAHAAEIRTQRRLKREAKTPEESAALKERMGDYQRQWRAKLFADPDLARLDRFRQRERQSRRRRKANEVGLQAAAALAQIAGRQPRQAKKCAVCGKPVIGRQPTALCCSASCDKAKLAGYHAQRARPKRVACVICGVEFIRRTSRITCSRDCDRARRRRQRKKYRQPQPQPQLQPQGATP
jgi:hypothetical protein